MECNYKIFRIHKMVFSKKETRKFPVIYNLSILQPKQWEEKFGQNFYAISNSLNF